MGVDTRLFINKSWTIEDIKEVIQKRFSVPVKLNFHDWAPDYITMEFQLPKAENARLLHIHTNSFVGGLPAINIGFRSNPEGHEILKTLAKTFGGLFQEADTGDEFKEFQKPGEGNIDFVVRQAIKDDPSLGQGGEEMASYISEEKWRQTSDVWNKPNKPKE